MAPSKVAPGGEVDFDDPNEIGNENNDENQPSTLRLCWAMTTKAPMRRKKVIRD